MLLTGLILFALALSASAEQQISQIGTQEVHLELSKALCVACKAAVPLIKLAVKFGRSEQSVESSVCSKLGPLSSACHEFMPKLFDFIEHHMDGVSASSLCARFRLCPQ
ncbi:hypothetical protein CRM22_002725 [Opisthorchis felineus]|uniref:Saposin B-type domain-containing protein n=1 Tax=Opisthorchis felineus TaxID=147828 RepID=A0A4S2M973_OPIFE|nr:hypothetical protein CRM22_002725 [Opisthorchis felineus]